MARSGQFAVAVHVLCLLSEDPDKPVTSDWIAGSVNTNPVVIRRALGVLRKAGLVASTEGAGGGTTLARPAAKITLADVHAAVEAGPLFGSTRNHPNPACPVGRKVQVVLGQYLTRFESALEREMRKVTIADVTAGIHRPAKS